MMKLRRSKTYPWGVYLSGILVGIFQSREGCRLYRDMVRQDGEGVTSRAGKHWKIERLKT